MADVRKHFPHLLEVLPDAGDVTIETLELLWRAAPEQVGELDSVFAAGIQARLLKEVRAEIGVFYNVLQIPRDVLRQLWLLSHAAWSDFTAFDELKRNPDRKMEGALTAEAVEAANQILKGGEVDWPSKIPNLGEDREGLHAKAIRELYAVACAWTIAHEIGMQNLMKTLNVQKVRSTRNTYATLTQRICFSRRSINIQNLRASRQIA